MIITEVHLTVLKELDFSDLMENVFFFFFFFFLFFFCLFVLLLFLKGYSWFVCCIICFICWLFFLKNDLSPRTLNESDCQSSARRVEIPAPCQGHAGRSPMPPGHTVAVGSDDSKKNTSFNIHRNKTDITDSLDLQLQRYARCLGNCFVCFVFVVVVVVLGGFVCCIICFICWFPPKSPNRMS